jgi:hypothetical protein
LWNEGHNLLQGTVQELCRYLRKASAKMGILYRDFPTLIEGVRKLL